MVHTLELRVAATAAAALDKLCELAFADDRGHMGAVWLDRWSRTNAPPHLDSIGDGSVPVAVEVDAAILKTLTAQAKRLKTTPAAVASAVVSEHGHHVNKTCRPLVEGLPEPHQACWCAYLTHHHRS